MKDYSGVWILGEQRNGKVQTIAHELLNRGRSLADKRRVPLTAIILGKAEPEDLDMLIKRGADQVIAIEADELATFLPEPYTNAMAYLVDKYKPEIIIAGATSTGRTLMPLLAIRFHAGLTADCTGLDIEEETGNLLQTRPAIGGNIMATIKSPSHRPQMATVRPKSTRPAAFNAARTGKIIREEVDPSLLGSRVKLLKFTKSAEETANIQEADVIIAGGRGLKKGDNFQLINELAALLDGGRPGLDQLPPPGGIERQNRFPQTLFMRRHLRLHPASGRDQDGGKYCRHQHQSRSPDIPGGQLWHRCRPV